MGMRGLREIVNMPARVHDNQCSRLLSRIPRPWQCVAILLTYELLALVMTWPAVARLDTHIAGGLWDTLVHQWTFWWVRESIATGLNPFETGLLYYPVGVSLVSHNIAWLNIALWLPLQGLIGRYPAYNLLFISTFALNGFAMYLLAREWIGRSWPAFVAGLVFGFWPYTMSHTDHPNMIFICWVLLALLYMHRTLEHGQKRDAILSGVFIALIGITRWQLLVIGGISLVLYMLYRCLTDRGCRTGRSLQLLVLTAIVAGVLMAPLLVPVAFFQLTRSFPEDLVVADPGEGQADLLAYVLPGHEHPLWGDRFASFRENLDFFNSVLRVPFLGYLAIALALLGTLKRWKHARFWLLVGCVYLVLALGPELTINGQSYPGVPMPYSLFEDWLLDPIVRRPHRFNLFLGLPVGMLAALGVDELLTWNALRNKAALVVVVIGTLILFEYCALPYPTLLPEVPDWYDHLAEEPDDFGILDVPMHPRGYDKWYMLYQMTHRKPIVEGHVSRIPREAYEFLDSTLYLKKLHEENVMDPALMDVTHQLRALADSNVRYLILHPELASAEQIASWRGWLAFDPLYEDESLIVYRTDPRLGQDFTLEYEFTDELGLIRVDSSKQEVVLAGSGVLEVDARWASSRAPSCKYEVCLNLAGTEGKIVQTDCWPLSTQWPVSEWEANEVVRGEYSLQASPFLEEGKYALKLGLVSETCAVDEAALVDLGEYEIEALDRDFSEPTPNQATEVQFGDALLLRGYDLQSLADSLELILYWQARQRMDRSYKVFVHLVDSSTGDLVVQDDSVPRRWMYPTDWWEAGEVVEDLIELSMGSVPPGDYLLKVGVYDQDTGVRLDVYSEDGEQYFGDSLSLTEVQR
jgi:hypothetical protein